MSPMFVTVTALVTLVTRAACFSARAPVITSQPRSLRAPLSDGVTLACTVEHLGALVVVWKHGEEVLSAGAMMVSPDPRYSLGAGYNLRVESLRGRDEGAYTCAVSTLSGPVTLTHNLEILGGTPR